MTDNASPKSHNPIWWVIGIILVFLLALDLIGTPIRDGMRDRRLAAIEAAKTPQERLAEEVAFQAEVDRARRLSSFSATSEEQDIDDLENRSDVQAASIIVCSETGDCPSGMTPGDATRTICERTGQRC